MGQCAGWRGNGEQLVLTLDQVQRHLGQLVLLVN